MTEQEQRIAIAETCGWRCVNGYSEYWMPPGIPWLPETDHRKWLLPDYLHDLNAMHEAEKTLPAEQWNDYIQTLSIIASGLTGHMFFTQIATAAQRAEAFLKTIGK